MDAASRNARVRRSAAKLGLFAVAMFGFGYLLVPLYDIACQALGLNGKTGRVEAVAGVVDTSRTITVEFTGHASSGLPWEFRPMTRRLEVHPGETVVVNYYARNNTNETIVGQAVPSVAPARAAPHFKKIECFCFTRQELKPGEAVEMPVRFTVMPEISPDVETITLSYAFFNADKSSAAKYGGAAAPATGQHAQDGPHAARDKG
ncbi:MAG TPA: cytochrome c oxidase assembly protein [Burkholderiales bacterium]